MKMRRNQDGVEAELLSLFLGSFTRAEVEMFERMNLESNFNELSYSPDNARLVPLLFNRVLGNMLTMRIH